MAQLDVSEALTNPELTSQFVVLRRSETVGEGGLSSQTTIQLPASGVVTAASDEELTRGPDEEHAGRGVTIVTRFPLRGPAPGFQPDAVLFRGNQYVVANVEDYGAYGAGFVQAVARSMRNVDEAPQTLPSPTGEMAFEAMPNSMMIGALASPCSFR